MKEKNLTFIIFSIGTGSLCVSPSSPASQLHTTVMLVVCLQARFLLENPVTIRAAWDCAPSKQGNMLYSVPGTCKACHGTQDTGQCFRRGENNVLGPLEAESFVDIAVLIECLMPRPYPTMFKTRADCQCKKDISVQQPPLFRPDFRYIYIYIHILMPDRNLWGVLQPVNPFSRNLRVE
jgi:hypothetical protein